MPQLVRVDRVLRRCAPGLHPGWAFALLLCAVCAQAAPGKCKLGKIMELPITMDRTSPQTVAKINGTDVRFVVDSGAFYSQLDPGSAASLGLRVVPAPINFYEDSVGGRVRLSVANVKEFGLPGLQLSNVQFVVGGSFVSGQAVGVIGRNILQAGDGDYDLAAGVVRVMQAVDCEGTPLAYWLRAGDSYSSIDTVREDKSLIVGSHIPAKERFRYPIIGMAYVNGVAIRAMLDTGASTSSLTLKAAEKAGLKMDAPGVSSGGGSFGFGGSTVETYIVPVTTFKIGEEEIRNTHLRASKFELNDADMLLGADFFLSHHVYIANSQEKIYFSYNGGPVFNLAVQSASGPAPTATRPADAPASTAATAPIDAKGHEPTPDVAEPKESASEAPEYAQRGAAFRARGELDQSLKAFNRACELAPNNASYFYQRALLYGELKQSAPAMADLDRTIQLDAHHIAALLMRGAYRTTSGDKTGAQADLDAANALLSKEDNERLTLAADYANADLFQRAIEQYDIWTASHQIDVRLAYAFEGRCKAHALGNIDLQSGMSDCDRALRHAAKNSPFFAEASATRALLYLRLGEYDKSIRDYDASLKINPKNAAALYGRGIDKMRKQKTAEGQADIAQAVELFPKVADSFHQHGIDP